MDINKGKIFNILRGKLFLRDNVLWWAGRNEEGAWFQSRFDELAKRSIQKLPEDAIAEFEHDGICTNLVFSNSLY